MRTRASREACLLLLHDASIDLGYRCFRKKSGLPFQDSMIPPGPPHTMLGLFFGTVCVFARIHFFTACSRALAPTHSFNIGLEGGWGRLGLTHDNPLFFRKHRTQKHITKDVTLDDWMASRLVIRLNGSWCVALFSCVCFSIN